MQFIKTRDVKSPERDVSENAGIDFYIPENTPEFRQALCKKNHRLVDTSNLESVAECSVIDYLAGDDSNPALIFLKESFKYYNDDKAKHAMALSLADLCKKKNLSFLLGNNIYIAPHKAIIIPTGIKSKFGPELALIANNKSGIATKKQLIFGASVIDCSYQGEWHINLINTSDHYQTLEFGQKAIQFIPHLISTEPVEIVDLPEEEFYTEKTSRGEGWQGSTGIK